MATIQVNKSDNLLVFFNQYRQLCVYDKNNSTTGKYIPHTFVLLRQTNTLVQHWVSLKQDDYKLYLTCSDEGPDPDEYTYDEYDFADNTCQIWYDDTAEPSIVIGTGDIRDGINSNEAQLYWYSIPRVNNTPDQDIVFECVSPYVLRIHHKEVARQSEQVTFINSCLEQ